MKKIITLLAIILILSSCRQYGKKQKVEMKDEDYAEESFDNNQPNSSVTIHYRNGESKTENVNKNQIENPNAFQNSFSTENIEYSEEWRVRAFKVTKEYLIQQFPIDNKGCNLTGFGYYKPQNVRYIGSNQFELKVIINFKCNNDDYTHRKRLTMVMDYSQKQNVFGFVLIDDKYLN